MDLSLYFQSAHGPPALIKKRATPFDNVLRTDKERIADMMTSLCWAVSLPLNSTEIQNATCSEPERSSVTVGGNALSGMACFAEYIVAAIFIQVANAASSNSCGRKPDPPPPLSSVVSADAGAAHC